jgi:hypothetical protein
VNAAVAGPAEQIGGCPLKCLFRGVALLMSTPDQETLLRAVEDARRILGEFIEPGPRDATRTVERLLRQR